MQDCHGLTPAAFTSNFQRLRAAAANQGQVSERCSCLRNPPISPASPIAAAGLQVPGSALAAVRRPAAEQTPCRCYSLAALACPSHPLSVTLLPSMDRSFSEILPTCQCKAVRTTSPLLATKHLCTVWRDQKQPATPIWAALAKLASSLPRTNLRTPAHIAVNKPAHAMPISLQTTEAVLASALDPAQ